MIAKTILQGGKCVGEVLVLTTDRIHSETKTISFLQTKSKFEDAITVVTYPKIFLEELSNYVKDREGLVFVTRSGREVSRLQLAKTFARASTNLPFCVHPHVLRASTVTYLRSQGFSSSDI